MLEAAKHQRAETEKVIWLLSSFYLAFSYSFNFQKREEAALTSPIKKAAKDLEDIKKSQYLSDYQKIVATGICQIIQQQDALMGTISGLLEKERIRQELDDALQRDLEKISTNVNKRDRSIAVKTIGFLA